MTNAAPSINSTKQSLVEKAKSSVDTADLTVEIFFDGHTFDGEVRMKQSSCSATGRKVLQKVHSSEDLVSNGFSRQDNLGQAHLAQLHPFSLRHYYFLREDEETKAATEPTPPEVGKKKIFV